MKSKLVYIASSLLTAALLVAALPSHARAQDVWRVTESLLGGEYADFSSTPIVLLGTDQYICTGLLVGPREVLTAAHCASAKAEDFVVYVGGEKHGVAEVYFNQEYVQDGEQTLEQVQNDLGMIILDSPATALPCPILTERPISKGDNATVAGYGTNESSGDSGSTPFEWGRYAALSVDYANDGIISSTGKKSTCPGDSGGPLLKNIGGHVVAVGTTSAGTNEVDEAGYCRHSGNGLSVWVDLQSERSLDFLAQFPGVQYLSGQRLTLLEKAQMLDRQLARLVASNGKTFKSRAAAALSSASKLRRYADDESRASLVGEIVRFLRQAVSTSSLSQGRKAAANAAEAARTLIELDIQ